MNAAVLAALATAVLIILVGSAMANPRRPGPGRPQRRITRRGLDRQRFATPQQRRALYRRQRGLCAVCGLPLAGREVDAHHVVAWSRGGRTVLSNLVLVHETPCHEQLTAQQARLYHWRRAGVKR